MLNYQRVKLLVYPHLYSKTATAFLLEHSAMDTSFSGPLLVNDGWPWERARELGQKDACGDRGRDFLGGFTTKPGNAKFPHLEIMSLLKKMVPSSLCQDDQSVLHFGSKVFTRSSFCVQCEHGNVAAISFYEQEWKLVIGQLTFCYLSCDPRKD
jgi:hypothetical protein